MLSGQSTQGAGAYDFSTNKTTREPPKLKSSFRAGTLHAAAELNDIASMETLLKTAENVGMPTGMTLNLKEDVMGREASHVAAQNAHSEMVAYLAKHANMGATDNFGVTPLMLAASNNDIKSMEAILSKRSSCVDVDLSKDTPLHWAATRGSVDAVKLLLKRGSPVDPVNQHESATPLMRAAFNGHLEVVKVLLDASANIFMRNKQGSTALHQASYMNHIATVELLASRGGNALIDQPNAKGLKAIDMAISDDVREVLARK